MVEAPADHPWSSYRTNALGTEDPVISPHSLYAALGDFPEKRQTAYPALFADVLSDDLLLLDGLHSIFMRLAGHRGVGGATAALRAC